MDDLDLQRELRTIVDQAAAPVTAAEAQLMARETPSRRTFRGQSGLWTHRRDGRRRGCRHPGGVLPSPASPRSVQALRRANKDIANDYLA